MGSESPVSAASSNPDNAERRDPRRTALLGGIFGFNALFFLFLLLKPVSHSVILYVDNLAITIGVFAAGIGSAAVVFRAWKRLGRRSVGYLRSAALISLGITAFGVGEAIWTYYELVVRRETPFPSWADAGYLLTYPFLLAGILWMPARRLSGVRRVRLIFDGLIAISSICTFSWYFVLGPTIMKGAATPLAKVLGAAYPFGDLVLLFCLFVLSFRMEQDRTRTAVAWLTGGLLCFVVADTAFCFLTLHDKYQTGSLFDVGWCLGFMLAGYSVYLLASRDSADSAVDETPAAAAQERLPAGASAQIDHAEKTIRLMMPYGAVVSSWALVAYAHWNPADNHLERGLFVGSAFVAVSVLIRQILAIAENARLNRSLIEAYADLGAKTRSLAIINSELQTANTRLEALATTDGLTGLLNHRTFQERLAEEYERSIRYGRTLSVLLLDVDKFKQYNDTFGHPAGDIVLRSVGAILRTEARTVDVVARYGGEEFVILLPECNEIAARASAERFRNAIEVSEWPGRAITVSIGASTIWDGISAPADMVAAADLALYRSKHRGRNCVTHVADVKEIAVEGLGQSYSDMIDQLLKTEHNSLVSAFEHIRGVLAQSYDVTVESWSRLLDLRDKETEGHSARVTEMAVKMARRIGFTPEEVMYVRWGALLHDIGKIGVPDHILHKPGKLNEDEWETMRTHPTVAYDMLWRIPFLRPAVDIPFCHHEKWDGTGYPQGLQGDDIPLAARLFAVIDVWDALSNERCYRQAWSEERVRAHLRDQAGIHFDPRAVDILFAVLDDPDEVSMEASAIPNAA